MTALAVANGFLAVFRQIDGLRTVRLGEPSGNVELPCLYLAYQEFARPLRSNPPATNNTVMQHVFAARLQIQWVENENAEMQLVTLVDAIPDAVDRDPRLGGALTRGLAYVDAGRTGFVTISGVTYRIVDYTCRVKDERAGT